MTETQSCTMAAVKGDAAAVAALLDAGADPEARAKDGHTPLHIMLR